MSGHSLVPLRDLILESQNGLSKRSGTDGVETPVLRLADITAGAIDESDPREIRLTAKELAKYTLQHGDLVCIRVNGSKALVGRVIQFRANRVWAYCDHFIRLRPNQVLVDHRYLAYYFNSQTVRRHIELNMVSSAGQNTVSQGTMLDIPVPCPGLDTQREVVAELEKQFSRLDEAVANLQRVKANLKRYKDSVYSEAFGNAPNSTLGELIEVGPQNGLYLPKDMYGDGVPILRIDDYQTAWIRPVQELRRVNAAQEQISTWALCEDDLVVNRVNSMTHLGKCVRIPKSLAGTVFESNMMRMRLTAAASPKYVEHYLASRIGKKRLTGNAKWAVNQASINQKDVRATPIFVPDLAAQLALVTEIVLGFNRSMQHTKHCVSRRSVANEAKTTDLLHAKPESFNVGTLEERRISPTDISIV